MITYIHRNVGAGYSINKVTQTIIRDITNKEEFYAPTYHNNLIDVIKNILFVWKNRNKVNYNHITGGLHYGVIGLIGCKSVLTIHDTAMVDYFKCSWIKRVLMEWLWFKIPLKLVGKIVCISENTKNSIKKYTNRTDIKVIYNAVDPSFTPYLKEFNFTKPNILIIGTAPNKNLEKTFESLSGFSCHLTIIGKLDQQQLDLLREYQLDYTNKINLSDEEIKKEYEDADIVSFVSKFEGFGMPIIEANSIGRPVVCSNIPVLKEIGGNSVLYVEPNDVDDIRRGFDEIVKNANLREQLIANGFENVKRFSQEAILKQWLDLYKD